MLKTHYFKGVFLVCLASLFWSSAGLFIKLVELPALQIAMYRSLIAGLFFLIYISFQWRKAASSFRLNRSALITAIFYTGTVSLFVIANKLTTSANAVFLQYTAPVYVILISYFVLRERMYVLELVTVAACMVGMVLFFFEEEKSTAFLGNIIGVLSGAAFALLQVYVKKTGTQEGDLDLKGILNLTLGNAMTVLFMLAIITGSMLMENRSPFLQQLTGAGFFIDIKDALGLIFLGVIQLGMGYLCFIKAVKHISYVEVSIYTLLEPICNPLWTFLGTGEMPGTWALIGGGIVLTAITINSIFTSKVQEG